VEAIRDRVNSGYAAIDFERLIKRNRTLAVSYVEPIRRHAEFFVFPDLQRQIEAKVEVVGDRCPLCANTVHDVREAWLRCGDCGNNRCPALHSESFVVAIDHMWDQLVEWRTRLDVEVAADHHLKRRLI